jgi:hypothetical protein
MAMAKGLGAESKVVVVVVVVVVSLIDRSGLTWRRWDQVGGETMSVSMIYP